LPRASHAFAASLSFVPEFPLVDKGVPSLYAY
jgi:hypothetical protein